MKKVYIPTNEEIQCMADVGINVYTYLLNKTIESIVMADVIYEEEDMFDVSYDRFSEYPEILYAIAKMYPERIKENDRTMNDIDLCMKLIPTLKQPDKSIYGLDGMTQFSDTVLQNPGVIRQTIKTLSNQIQNNPRYRFEYFSPNPVLDDIFACETGIDTISTDVADDIIYIEPAYYAKLKDKLLEDKQFKDKKDQRSLYAAIIRSILRYSFRYGISVQEHKIDDEKTKKLIRHLEEHKKNYHF